MKLQITTPSDFSFLQCLEAHGWKNLKPFTWDADSQLLTRVEDFGTYGVASLIIHESSDMIEVETGCAAPADEVLPRVNRMLQLDIPMDGFHTYCGSSPILDHIPTLKQGRILRSPTLFEDVVKVIATTNTTWAQTKGMVARIVDNFGTSLPTDESTRAFPTPAQIANVSLEEFGEQARMGYRNAAVHKIATGIVEGTLDLEGLQDQTQSSPELYKKLLTLPGIGPYAASCLLIYLGHYDRVNVDSWARTLVGKELGKPVTDKEAHAFFEEYAEWKALVYHFYKWKSDDTVD